MRGGGGAQWAGVCGRISLLPQPAVGAPNSNRSLRNPSFRHSVSHCDTPGTCQWQPEARGRETKRTSPLQKCEHWKLGGTPQTRTKRSALLSQHTLPFPTQVLVPKKQNIPVLPGQARVSEAPSPDPGHGPTILPTQSETHRESRRHRLPLPVASPVERL